MSQEFIIVGPSLYGYLSKNGTYAVKIPEGTYSVQDHRDGKLLTGVKPPKESYVVLRAIYDVACTDWRVAPL